MDKNLLILGATSDMAKATAQEFAAKGWTLTLAARRPEQLEPMIKDLKVRHSTAASAVKFDARDFRSHASFYSSLDPKPDAVLVAFGVLGDQTEASDDFSKASEIIEANYTGAVSILNIVAKDMEARKADGIIGISSVAGERGRQSNYLYGSAKAGLTAYLSGLRNRLAKSDVHVMTVKPGFVRTKMTEGLPLPAPLTAEPKQVGKKIYKAFEAKTNTVYVLPIWRYVMFCIRNIPEVIFKKLEL